MKRMSHEAIEFAMPPPWCSGICRNAMNDLCVTSCAIKRDCSEFEVKTDLNLEDMPPMPDQSQLETPAEKFTCLYIYTQRMVDHLKGVTHEPRLIKRPNFHNTASGWILTNKPSEVILFGDPQKDPSTADRAKLEDQEV